MLNFWMGPQGFGPFLADYREQLAAAPSRGAAGGM
jgi:hypothetical protein